MLKRAVALTVASVTASIAMTGQTAMDPAYVKAVENWRARHEADYTREYVPLAGLFFLKPGANTAGSAAGSDVRLPERAPASVGRFVLDSGHVRFEPGADSRVTLRGAAVRAPLQLKSDASEDLDELAIGTMTFWIHEAGDRRSVRLRDPESDAAKSFKGFRWFPIDARYRVTGRFIKDPKPRVIEMPLLTGDIDSGTTEGVVEFAFNGATIRLRPITTEPGRLWFIFRDATAGHETYEAARFLYADLKADGTVEIDFNRAYNPPCSFNTFTTCPLPLPENRLAIRIPAGEMAYAGSHQ
jgi:uncharacterized protein (DUF1684 family)